MGLTQWAWEPVPFPSLPHPSEFLQWCVCRFCGATAGYLPCVPIAISVTTTGRQMIEHARGLVQVLRPGSLVVYGDTDSLFVKLNLPEGAPLEEHFAVGRDLAAAISKTYRHPNDLEFEKVYKPLLMIGKKRYAGLKFESPTDKPKLDTKGLQLVRRDTVPLAREACAAVLDAFLHQGSVDAAMRCARDAVADLVFDRVPFDKLVLSKQLRGAYKNPESQPHLVVANKIQKRTGEITPSGTRIRFVYLRAPELMDGLLAARAECPEFAREHDLKVDVLHYLDSQLLTPLLTLLEPMVAGAREALLGDPETDLQIKSLRAQLSGEARDAKRIKLNKQRRQREITAFFSART